ncbi:hypothetical protein RHSIM_Rhsim10G0082600 [Rhododendron simsii]|uniref:Uncharacterized protein n=1 Tax=Rhododendron simsii TaxID=118357 RepID=A0A834LDS6_RHOSS|nr:hypothetical protein RHSIM_Rhsim10G0082600 [Rhododendron simsii]
MVISSDNNGDGDEVEDDDSENEYHRVFDYCFSDLPKELLALSWNGFPLDIASHWLTKGNKPPKLILMVCHILTRERCNVQMRRNNSSVANLGSHLCITEEIKQSLIWQWKPKGGSSTDNQMSSSIEGSTRDQEGNSSESDKAIDWRKESNQPDTFGSSRR